MDPIRFDSLSVEEKEILKKYYQFLEKMQLFQNQAKPSTFEYLFGKEEGERLWQNFVVSAGKNIFEMIAKNYFSDDQKGDLIANICSNEFLYAH